MIKINTCVGV